MPAWSSPTARSIRRLRVVPCLAEMIQQIHSFRASGVRSFQDAFVVGSESMALHKSAGVLCTGPGLLSFFTLESIGSMHYFTVKTFAIDGTPASLNANSM